MSMPSIRECELKLDDLLAAPATAENLFNAVALGKALLHYVRNAGTPPAAPASAKLQAQSLQLLPRRQSTPMHLLRPVQSLPLGRLAAEQFETPSPARPARAAVVSPPSIGQGKVAAELPPPGCMTTQQICLHFGKSERWLLNALASHGFPAPTKFIGRQRYWPREIVLAWSPPLPAARARKAAAERAPRPSRANPTGPQPAGTETIAQLCARLDRSQPWFYQQMDERRGSGFPRPTTRWGLFMLWSTEAVNAWLELRVSAKTTTQPDADTARRRIRKPFGAATVRAVTERTA